MVQRVHYITPGQKRYWSYAAWSITFIIVSVCLFCFAISTAILAHGTLAMKVGTISFFLSIPTFILALFFRARYHTLSSNLH